MLYALTMIHRALTEHNLQDTIRETAAVLGQGGIVGYPTETFYGLGVRFDNTDSLKRLYDLKARPREKAMPVIVGSRGVLEHLVSPEWLKCISPPVSMLMERLWPGPLTLLLPAREGLSEYLTADTGVIAVRVPGESFALQLARTITFPITATSANPSGAAPADAAEKVRNYFGDRIDLLVDGGKTAGGLPSTIVDCTADELRIVREGAIPVSAVLTLLRN